MPKQDPTPENLTDVIASAGLGPGHSQDEACGHFDITITKDGSWYYRGTPIRRQALCRLFASVLRREEDGAYWLVTPAERGRIEVEDAPFTAVEMRASGAGRQQILCYRTNLDHEVQASETHPIRAHLEGESGTPRPYVGIRGNLEALIVRSVFYDMVDLAVEGEVDGRRVMGVWSCGRFFPIGPASG